MARNKTHIRITSVANKHWHLMSYFTPRRAHEAGQEEVVNNTVLGTLRKMQEYGYITFEVIND